MDSWGKVVWRQWGAANLERSRRLRRSGDNHGFLQLTPSICRRPSKLYRTGMLCLTALLMMCCQSLAEEPKEAESDDIAVAKGEQKTNPILALFQRSDNDDSAEDSMFDPLQGDVDCDDAIPGNSSCRISYSPPDSTIETEKITVSKIDATCSYGGADPDEDVCKPQEEEVEVDTHWGKDPAILLMRDKLRVLTEGGRPPIFLMPGLASTRLVAWRFKRCSHPLLSDIKVQENVWLNINLMMQMSTIDGTCMNECLRLGRNQTDADDVSTGCKLRPDEGLDAISSLSPGSIGSNLLVGGTNTVYAWLIQWLADNLGYDVAQLIGLPYDWRLSPDKMEKRDGFLTLTRRRIEAAVQSNGKPGIMVAHSMGNTIFRYFLNWLRKELREEAYQRYIRRAKRMAKAMQAAGMDEEQQSNAASMASYILPGWMSNTGGGTVTEEDILDAMSSGTRHAKLWERAQLEGDTKWYEWVEAHIWTYVGLSAPLLGAVNPLRAVLSGENMGLPVTDRDARIMELTFGSTHTVNPVSAKIAFCDQWDIEEAWDEEAPERDHADSKLACLDDLLTEIELSAEEKPFAIDPWEKFPALKSLLRERVDWDTKFPMILVTKSVCEENEKSPCFKNTTFSFGAKDIQTGSLFTRFSEIWKEEGEPLSVKREQLQESFWDTDVPNILNQTYERPLIKHVIMAYGVDVPTETAYEYVKEERPATAGKVEGDTGFDGIPTIQTILYETTGGRIEAEKMDAPKPKLTDFFKKKPKRVPLHDGELHHSGDGSVPYLSLAWAHTWLLHAERARRHSGNLDGPVNPLDDIIVSHRPEGAMDWAEGPPPKRINIVGEKKVEESNDTGTAHPHGTKYKPEMVRYHNEGTSRTTGIEYTTTVIEALAVEHKETTRITNNSGDTKRRNYDILAAVFTGALKYMHDDLDIL